MRSIHSLVVNIMARICRNIWAKSVRVDIDASLEHSVSQVRFYLPTHLALSSTNILRDNILRYLKPLYNLADRLFCCFNVSQTNSLDDFEAGFVFRDVRSYCMLTQPC